MRLSSRLANSVSIDSDSLHTGRIPTGAFQPTNAEHDGYLGLPGPCPFRAHVLTNRKPIPASLAPSPEESETDEERTRARLAERQKFLNRVWESGPSGKIFVILVLVAVGAPFLFDVFAMFAVWAWIWPGVVTTTDKVAALGFLFVVLNGLAFTVARWGAIVWELAYVMRPRRGRSKR